MTERVEKAYYLKEEELAVLLAMKGVRGLYGFRMDNSVGIESEELYRILFEMARKEIVSSESGKLWIHTDIEAALKEMAEADNVLILANGEKYPESCIYVGTNTVFVQLLGQSGRIYRIEQVGREEAVQKIQEYGWTVPGFTADVQDGFQSEEIRQQVIGQARSLYGVEKDTLLQKKEVLCSLTQYSVRQERKIRQLLILNGVLEDYLSVSDDGQDDVFLYSDAKSKELLSRLIGGTL